MNNKLKCLITKIKKKYVTLVHYVRNWGYGVVFSFFMMNCNFNIL